MVKADEWLEKIEKELKTSKDNGEITPRVMELLSELRIHQAELEMQNEELKHSQEEYAELYNKYLDLYNDMPVGYFTLDINGIIRNVNVKGTELLQTKKENLIGRGFSPFIPKADEWKYYQALANSIDTYKNQELELQLKKRDQTLFDAHMELMTVFDKTGSRYRVIITDISERKKAEEALRESEERYSELFNSMSEMFQVLELVYNDNGRAVDFYYRDVNPATERLLNMTRDQIVGKRAKELFGTVEDYWIQALSQVNETKEPMHIDNYSAELDKYYDVNAFKVEGQNKVAIVFTDITDRKKAEEAIRESEEKYRTLFNSIDEGFCIVEVIFDEDNKPVDYQFLEVNPAFERQTGLREAQGKRMRELRPNHEEHWFEIYGEIALTGKPMRFENPAKALGIFYDVYAFKIGGSKSRKVAILFNDITERKKAEEALKEARDNLEEQVEEQTAEVRRLVDIVESSEDAIVGIDSNDVIFSWNKGAEKIYGYSADEIIGKHQCTLMEPEKWDKASKIIEKVKKGQNIAQQECKRLRKDGSTVDVSITYSAIKNREGKIMGISAIARDITERKKSEEHLKYLITELKRSNKELQQFAYISSHDLQEPLRTIASFTQLLQRRYEGKFDSDADEFMEYVVEAAIRMKQQIEGLLEYSRVGTKGREFKLVDLNEILSQTIQSLNTSIEESNAKITFDELPSVMGDGEQLQRVFQNLISNAIRFRKCEEPLKVHISANKDVYNEEYIFSVQDNGIGIEKQYMERIFTIFQRLHTRDVYQGTGIGLSIVKRIIERHGGRIWVESEFGKGSVFYFTILVEQTENGGGHS